MHSGTSLRAGPTYERSITLVRKYKTHVKYKHVFNVNKNIKQVFVVFSLSPKKHTLATCWIIFTAVWMWKLRRFFFINILYEYLKCYGFVDVSYLFKVGNDCYDGIMAVSIVVYCFSVPNKRSISSFPCHFTVRVPRVMSSKPLTHLVILIKQYSNQLILW